MSETFEKQLKHLDSQNLKKLKKIILKIINHLNIGKPLRYGLKNERTIRIKPFRLIYSYDKKLIYLLKFEHRDSVY